MGILNKFVLGDFFKLSKKFPSESIHAIITDPPYLD